MAVSQRRLPWARALGSSGLAALLCFLPLSHALGFEFALAMTLVVAPLAAWGGVRSSSWARGAGEALLLLVPPLVLISLNTLRVRNCNYGEGLRLYLLLPVAGAIVAAGYGRAAGLVFGPAHPWRATAAVWGLGLLSLGAALLGFWREPQIFFTGAAYGWWPGALYDEALGVPPLLAWSRLADLAGAAVFVGVARLLRAWRAPRWADLAGALLPLLLWGALFSQRNELGYTQDRGSLERALGARLSAPGLELVYDRTRYDSRESARLLEDLRFRLQQVERFFGLPPAARPLRVYVYGSREQRRRLMGADRVSVAKPWSYEVHLLRPAYGDGIVSHELAHAVAARLSASPLGLPVAWGVLPRMGLVEGAAVAAEGERGELLLHGWAAAQLALGLAPSLSSILEAQGFFAQAPARAYVAAGSFVRWLVEQRGPAAFANLYRGQTFEASYGQSSSELEAAWLEFLRAWPTDATALEVARRRFERPSIFRRACAREVARASQEVGRLSGAGREEEALALQQRVCNFDPGDPGHLLTLLDLHIAAARWGEARAVAEQALAHPALAAVQRSATLERLGDVAWQEDALAAAQRDYAAALALPRDEAGRRSLGVKRWALLQQGELGRALRRYLLDPAGREAALVALALAAGEGRGEGVLDYLLGRALLQRDDEAGAASLLARARAAAPLPAVIGAETLRLLGISLYLAGRPEAALEPFTALAALQPATGVAAAAQDWIARCRWRLALPPSPAALGGNSTTAGAVGPPMGRGLNPAPRSSTP